MIVRRQWLRGLIFGIFVAALTVLTGAVPLPIGMEPAPPEADPAAPGSLERAVEQWDRLPRAAARRRLAASAGVAALQPAGSVTGTVWRPIGPNPITEQGCCGSTIVFDANGRVNSMAVDPTNANVLYLGSAGGGVWRSDNAGSTWRPLTDGQSTLGIGSSHALAVDPNNPSTLYAGTSNFALLAQSQPRPIDYSLSKGILKSTDGGASWIVLGSGVPTGNTGNALQLFSRTEITTVIVDPANSTRLYAAAGRPPSETDRGGLFRSTDAGQIWTKGLEGSGTADGLAESLVLDTSSPSTSRVLYAGVNGRGVLKSSDGGLNWSPVLTTTTAAVVSAGAGAFHKVMVALAPTASPPNPAGQVIYVTLMVGDTGIIFQNTNGGAENSWTKKSGLISGPQAPCCTSVTLQGSTFSDMVVDPASPGDGVNDLIHWGGFSQYLSKNSGDAFAEVGQVHGTHGDHQAFLLVPRPGNSSVIYIGDDGGIWRSEDQGAHWTGTSLPQSPATINAGGLQTATLYALAVKQDATASVTLGGTQDSGVVRGTGGPAWTGTSNDAFDLVFDRVNTNHAYSIQNGCGGDCLHKSTDGGATWPDITPATIPLSERGQGRNRLAVDPTNAGHVYVGGSAGSVYQTMNGGTTFRSLGKPAPGKYVSSLNVARTDSNSLVIAANNIPADASNVASRVFVTTNALAADATQVTFTDITRNLPTRFVTRVAFAPGDETVIYATVAGFGSTTPGQRGHVFRTTLAGTEWTDISPEVDIPFNALALDGMVTPPVIYVGTDLGVLRSTNDGTTWAVVDDIHLPNAAVSDLALNEQAGVLRAGTWGRGVFDLSAPAGPVIAVDQGSLPFGSTCVSGATLPIDVYNDGNQPLTITGVQVLAGSPAFSVNPSPATPMTLAPGGHAFFSVTFVPPTAPGNLSAIIRISSNDPAAPHVELLATGRRDAIAPTITCPAPIVAECAAPSGTAVSFSATATDVCGVASISCPASGSAFPLGTTGVSCTATDTAGNSNTCSSSVTVADTTPPVISSVAATPSVLWAPNHQMVSVSLAVGVTDLCDAAVAQSCKVVSVMANEPILGPGSGHTSPDYAITGSLKVDLRAERSGMGTGRIYTVTVQCSDASKNTATSSVTVTVPRDQQ